MQEEGPAPPSGDATRRAVEDVLRDQEARHQRRTGAVKPPSDHSTAMLIATGVLAILCALIWLSPPAALQPAPFGAPAPVQIEAGLRMDIYVTALRVEQFREARGRLPVTIEEFVEDPIDREDLSYERLGSDRFQLAGERAGAVVRYRSDEPLEQLTDPTLGVIGGGPTGGGP